MRIITFLTLLACTATIIMAMEAQERPHFLFSTDPDIHIKVKIHIGLIGFNAAAEVPAMELEELLSKLYGIHRPAVSQGEDDVKLMPLHYDIEYEAKHLVEDQYITMIHHALEFNNSTVPVNNGTVPMYGVNMTMPLLNTFDYIFNDAYKWEGGVWNDVPSSRAEYAVLIIKTDKSKLGVTGEFNYAYKWDHTLSQSWIGRDRFVVYDVSAGPVSYGSSIMEYGTYASPSSGFVLRHNHGDKDALISKRIVDAVITAIQHVFLPDVDYMVEPSYNDHVLVPILVFRDHNLFDPLNKASIRNSGTLHALSDGDDDVLSLWEKALTIDISAIRAEIEKILLPKQKLIFVIGSHVLADHPRIYSAFLKSLSIRSYHEVGPGFGQRISTKTVSDPRELMYRLRDAADMLTDALIPDDAKIKSKFFGVGGSRPQTIPVFVFSRSRNPTDGGQPEFISFPEHSTPTVSSSRDGVLVIQDAFFLKTKSSFRLMKTWSPYFSQSKTVKNTVYDATKSVMFGIASALSGVSNLCRRRGVYDYTYSTGYVPFVPSPFAEKALSSVFADVTLRNYLTSGIYALLERVSGAVSRIESFAMQYSVNVPWANSPLANRYQYGRPLQETSGAVSPVQSISMNDGVYDPLERWRLNFMHSEEKDPEQSSRTFLDRLTHHGLRQKIPLSTQLIIMLHTELEALEDAMMNVLTFVDKHDFEQAITLLNDTLSKAEAFALRTDKEVTEMSRILECCTFKKM